MRKLNKFNKIGKYYKGFLVNFKIRNYLVGKILAKGRIPFFEEELYIYKRLGYIKEQKAIEINGQLNLLNKFSRSANFLSPNIVTTSFIKLKCNRCHNTRRSKFVKFYCANCEGDCFYCRHCIQMGRMSSCTTLINWVEHKNLVSNKCAINFEWAGELSMLQLQAAKELIDSYRKCKNHLVHAVCGAGKTELLFPVIYEALKDNKRVCIATPRTDVVLELYPRLCQAFPKTTIHALYGGAKNDMKYAPLIISTTHQLYKFQEAFDLIIVDEADAFPYTYDETLQNAVLKSKKEDAPIFFVTATPSKQLLLEMKRSQASISYIPIRYHQQLLPVPSIQSLWRYQHQFKKNKVPQKLKLWIQKRLNNNERYLIFFPTIDLMEGALPLFQQIDKTVLSVHAEDPDRKEKVMQLRNDVVNGLLTTTILERGITIKNLHVAVVGAENKIFTSSALIQIAGRVGRHVDFASGEVVFFHHGISMQMDQAIYEIQLLNDMAEKVKVIKNDDII